MLSVECERKLKGNSSVIAFSNGKKADDTVILYKKRMHSVVAAVINTTVPSSPQVNEGLGCQPHPRLMTRIASTSVPDSPLLSPFAHAAPLTLRGKPMGKHCWANKPKNVINYFGLNMELIYRPPDKKAKSFQAARGASVEKVSCL